MRRAAGYTLAVLTLINLFNYLDRWVIAALVESLRKSELHLTDTELGFIASGFIIIYTLASPVFGTLGDRRARPPRRGARLRRQLLHHLLRAGVAGVRPAGRPPPPPAADRVRRDDLEHRH